MYCHFPIREVKKKKKVEDVQEALKPGENS